MTHIMTHSNAVPAGPSASRYGSFAGITLCLFALTLAPATSLCQPVRMTEHEIRQQEIFLDAYGKQLMGKTDSARVLFEQLVREDSRNDAALYQLAAMAREETNYDQAAIYARQCLAADPANKWYKIFLAEIYENTGKDREAAQLYEQIATSETFDQELYYRWAYFLLRAEVPDQALKVYDEIEKKNGLNEEIVRHKYTVFMAWGEQKKAEKELLRLIQAFPDKVEYLRLLATFYEQQQQSELAMSTYRKILALDPADAQAQMALANSRKQSGDDTNYLNALRSLFQKPDIPIDDKIREIMPYVEKIASGGDPAPVAQLLELAHTICQVHPGDAKGYALYGDLLYFSGRPEEALAQYQASLDITKQIYSVWEQVMYLYATSERYGELFTMTEEVMDRFPNQPTAYLLQGRALNQLNRYSEAVPPLQQALLMASRNTLLQVEVLNELAVSAYKQGDYAQAGTRLEKALEASQGSHPPTLSFYGDVLFRRGDEANALKYWQMARDKGDKSPELLKKITDKKL